jgi:hypothetical protein
MNQKKQLQTQQASTSNHELIAAVIINGDLSKLSQQQRVEYYNGYCERLGLDPYTKPFDLLRLNGREILYCTRSGAQQLNKLHNVSHAITSRDTNESAGVYMVTSRACLPDGRCTESIGAVNIAGLKGEAYANAVMKAETKAKRRATLDLLGLGVLDETEAQDLTKTQNVDVSVTEQKEAVKTPENAPTDADIKCRMTYKAEKDIIGALEMAENIGQLRTLYKLNQVIVDKEGNETLKELFINKSNELKNGK